MNRETVQSAIEPAETPELFIDLGFAQYCKHGERICGDAFKFQKCGDGRVFAVLSDGLGSGVKANILASMTATMALKFATENADRIVHAAEIMMGALPICQVRKISYATFTIVNADISRATRIIEMGNPRFLLFRGGRELEVPYEEAASPRWHDRAMKIYHCQVEPSDRLIFFSDGISQAGMGSKEWPLGWRVRNCSEFIRRLIARQPDISSRELCDEVICEARRKEPGRINKDDMTCAAMHFRRPRRMLLFTGPPYDRRDDAECAALVAGFDGEVAIAGGTSAEIVSRELHRKLEMDLKNISSEMPPVSYMEGVDLVTEGIFTLTATARYLEEDNGVRHHNAAGQMMAMMLRNDIIDILVGTRINEAHQDPRLPQDLELRRNIVKRLAAILEKNFLKKVNVKYV